MTTLHQGVAPLLGDSLSPHRPVFYAKDLSYDFENHDLDRKLFGWIDKSVVAVLNTLTSPLSLTWSASHDNFASLSVGSGETKFLSTATSDYAVTPDGLEFLGGRGEVQPGKRQYMSDVHNYLIGLDSFPPTRISSSEDKKKEVLQVQKDDGSWSGGTKHELMALQISAIVASNKVRVEASGHDSKHVSVVVVGEDSYFHVRGTASDGQLDLSVSPLYQNVTDRYLDQPGDVSLRALLVATLLATLAGDVLGLDRSALRSNAEASQCAHEAGSRSSAGVEGGSGPSSGGSGARFGGAGSGPSLGPASGGLQDEETAPGEDRRNACGSSKDSSSFRTSRDADSDGAATEGERFFSSADTSSLDQADSAVKLDKTLSCYVSVQYGIVKSECIEIVFHQVRSLGSTLVRFLTALLQVNVDTITFPPYLILDQLLASREGTVIAASSSLGCVFKLVERSGDYLQDEINNEIDVYAKLSASDEGRKLCLPFLGAFTSPDGYVGLAVKLAEPIFQWRDCDPTELIKLLGGLHKSDLVHGDIKPSNFARLANGQLRLLDFGRTRRGTQEEMQAEMAALMEELDGV
ncbi:uncharacterized protein JCM10292_005537 [Rhodotorula paludigena]|uniref:uncharacterized protein n=1 Tax=Rhodotorula paludigena TaxID=86838 RepID=UPI0031725C3E